MQPLWLCLRLPSLPLEALPLPGSGAAAVFERKRGRKVIVCVNAAAEALGLAPGLELGAAAALAPELQTFERSPRAERAALASLCAAAYGFSSRVTAQSAAPSPRMHALWLEIGTSLKLFGGLDALVDKLRRAFAALGYTFQIGVAPTMEAAYLLAEREPVLELYALWPALGGLPLCAARVPASENSMGRPLADLPVPDETIAALAGSGLKKFGEVLALPLDALARRFSPDFTDWLGRVGGRLPEARRYFTPPERYRRYFELLGEVDTTEALRFPIRRLLAEFAAYLTARDTGAPTFTLELEHEGGTVTPLVINLASPGRDAVHFGVLVHARLERLAVPAPVRGIALVANRFAPVSVRQFDMFATRGTEEHEWQEVLDRLHARLGAAAVQGLGLHADHRPERAWSRVPGAFPDTPDKKERPLWLLPQPRELGATPRCVRGPERIEGGWWDGGDVQRDYYTAETGDGAKLWVYRDRRSGSWFLHGLWA